MPIMEEQEELRQSFRNEGYSYVSRAREILAELVDPSKEQEIESLVGVTRTLKQRASLAGLFDISNLAYQLEGEIRRLEETNSELTADSHETLGSYVDSIEQFLHFCYQHTGSDAQIEQLLKPEEGFQLTRQIQELYMVESQEHIQDINSLLLKLESGKANPAHTLEEIYRNVHSIKGDSNALSMVDVAEKAHSLESFLSELQQQKSTVDYDQMETLFAEVALLERLVLIASGALPKDQAGWSDWSAPAEPVTETVAVIETDSSAQAPVAETATEPIETAKAPESEKVVKGKKTKTIKVKHVKVAKASEAADAAETAPVTAGTDQTVEPEASLESELDAVFSEVGFADESAQIESQVFAAEDSAETEPEIAADLSDTGAEAGLDLESELEMVFSEISSGLAEADAVSDAPSQDFAAEAQSDSSLVLEPETPEVADSEVADSEMAIAQVAEFEAEAVAAEIVEAVDQTAAFEAHEAPYEPPVEAHVDEDVDDLDYLLENQEILELYYQEAQDLMAEIDSGLSHLQDDGADGALINDIYRAAHTLKGNSFALGVEGTGKASQALEEALHSIRVEQYCPPEQLPRLANLLKRIRTRLASIGSRLMAVTPSAPEAAPQPAYAPAGAQKYQIDFSQIYIPDEIRQIYIEESSDLLEQISHQLLSLELGQSPLGDALNEIFRLVHTLKGNSSALGITQLSETLNRFESSVDQLRKQPESYDGPEVLFREIEPLQHLFSQLGGEADLDPTLTAPDIDLSEIPEEIRGIFLEEAFELLENISHHLLDLEQGEVTLEHALDEVYRSIHTFKGNAHALGLGWIGESAHTMESLLSTLRDDPSQYGPSTTEALFRHLEGLRRQTESLQLASEPKPEPPSMTDTLRATPDQRKTMITQERTPQQVIEAVRRDKTLFDDFEKRISSSKHKIDNKTTGKIKVDMLPELAGQQAPQATGQSAPPAVDETIRVSIGKVDKLINLADELLISRISFEQHLRTLRSMVSMFETAQQQLRMQIDQVKNVDLETYVPLQTTLDKLELETNLLTKGIRKNNAAFGLLVDEIQYHSRSTRMLPAAYLINPVRLVVRNTSAKLGKRVQLQIVGEEIEMDRLLIERLKDPLGHLLRNAIDHGIETPDERTRAGKSPEARITIAISVAGNMIRFQIHDDGRGINYNKVRQKAVAVGMLSAESAEQLTEYDLHTLLFTAGFSTTEQITDVSGRGVGLDVVKATIDGLNGNIEVTSSEGRGTIFSLLVPVTLTTFDAFLVELAGQTFALPRSGVIATLSVKQQDVTDSGISKSIFFADHPVRMVSLQQLLQLPVYEREESEFAVLVVESGQQRLALMVDSVVESQQMVMKTLGSQLKKVAFISGATLLGSGEPVVVLNLTEIVAQLTNIGTERMSIMVPTHRAEVGIPKRKGKTRVLVVDDSVTTRTLEKNILEAAGFEVVIAKHGREGQEAVIREMPDLDLIITDVEMPHMNGFEFASWIKLESEYRATPVIMVTSLASPEFKAKGFASGIDAYIVKAEFNQQTLLDTISQLLVSA